MKIMNKHSGLAKAFALCLMILTLAGTLCACSGASYKSDGSVTLVDEKGNKNHLQVIGYDVNSKGSVSVYLMGSEDFTLFHVIEIKEDIVTNDGMVLYPAGKHKYQQVGLYMINSDGEKVEPFLVNGYCGRGCLPADKDDLGVLMFAFEKGDYKKIVVYERGIDDPNEVEIPVNRLKIPDENKVYEDIEIEKMEMLSFNFDD